VFTSGLLLNEGVERFAQPSAPCVDASQSGTLRVLATGQQDAKQLQDVWFSRVEGPSMTSLNVFVTESNVELYLSKLYTTINPAERDNLLRLLANEVAAMGYSREHVENGERRMAECRQRLERQRLIVSGLPSEHPDALLLETLERTQVLLVQQLESLRERQKRL